MKLKVSNGKNLFFFTKKNFYLLFYVYVTIDFGDEYDELFNEIDMSNFGNCVIKVNGNVTGNKKF